MLGLGSCEGDDDRRAEWTQHHDVIGCDACLSKSLVNGAHDLGVGSVVGQRSEDLAGVDITYTSTVSLLLDVSRDRRTRGSAAGRSAHEGIGDALDYSDTNIQYVPWTS